MFSKLYYLSSLLGLIYGVAMEEVIGEYVLNMSKENMKIAAVRGKVKLENVQLDGDLIGSHVLGAVGLSGFGVLSCWAKSLHVSIPWKRLETEPTKIEIRGVHLVCVPLTAATAHQMYGAGTQVDPRCSLRTRAKRLVLARMERNFWNGQIPGEGPPLKRVTRAVQEIERDWKKQRRRRRSSRRDTTTSDDESAFEEAIDNLVNDMSEADSSFLDSSFQSDVEDRSHNQSFDSSFSADHLPELPRDWKHKLRDKVLRNLEASLHDLHIRCEVAENGLGVVQGVEANTKTKSPARRAFAFGLTMRSMVARTANRQWEVGSHDKRDVNKSMTPAHGHLGPNEYVVKNNKIVYLNDVSVYWDDEPPLLLAETDLLRGNFRKVSPEKLHSRIASAMVSLTSSQEPGRKIREALYTPLPTGLEEAKPHQFVCREMSLEVRGRTSDRTMPGPLSCSADVLPLHFAFAIRPHQFVQYNQLKVAIRSQLRFDTMLRQRPSESPFDNPRGWWKYAIACVTSRPNSRPWEDIRLIIGKRSRYIDLVVKKNLANCDTNGYHAGLSEKESSELLKLEELLPVEALSAFHLAALRRVFQKRKSGESNQKSGDASPKKRSGRFRLLRGSVGGRKASRQDLKSALPTVPLPPSESRLGKKLESAAFQVGLENEPDSSRSLSLFEAVTMRLGKKTWYVDWKLHDLAVQINILGSVGNEPLAQLAVRASGSARSFGKGKQDFFFDISQFEAFHQDSEMLYVRSESSEIVEETERNAISALSASIWRQLGAQAGSPDLRTPSRFLDLPQSGVACRVVAGRLHGKQAISVAAHPATFVWNSSLLTGMSDFFPTLPLGIHTDLSQHVRDAATPLARKAQLALLSPGTASLHLNISAPKVWIPMVSKEVQGALYLDAGMLKMAGHKTGAGMEMNMNTLAKDIQVSFLRGRGRLSAALGGNPKSQIVPHLIENVVGRTESSVVYPFSIKIGASNQALGPEASGLTQAPENEFLSGTVRTIDFALTPVCLNLVDAEVLARSFGKWYSRYISKARTHVTAQTESSSPDPPTDTRSRIEHTPPLQLASMPQVFKFTLERLEMALEGHSKRSQNVSDDRSLVSLDSFHESSPSTRTYLVEVTGIGIKRSRRDHRAATRFSVTDCSIIRLKDGAQFIPFRNRRRDIAETQHLILTRSYHKGVSSPSPKILSASLIHDGMSHLDEVEVDIDSTTLRVTPTTLKDCAKAVRKIAELTQLLTREMERKIHEEGRKARRRPRRGSDREHQLLSTNNSSGMSTERPPSPVFSETMTDVTSIPEQEIHNSRAPQDSSILFRVTLRECTLLVGRPIAAITRSKSRHSEKTSFAVLQVLSNALIMFQSVENSDASGKKTLHTSVENLSSIVTTEFQRVDPKVVPPMIGPTGAEFRVVYSTENLGCVVSQDISLDCDRVRACLTPNDLTIMTSVSRKMFDRLRSAGLPTTHSSTKTLSTGISKFPFTVMSRYQKSGSGIATSIRIEVQEFSFVLLRAYKSHYGAPEFMDFNVRQLKGNLGGCVSALSGEFSAVIAVNFLNPEVSDWEYVMEPSMCEMVVDQMPNELVRDSPVRYRIVFASSNS